MKKFAQEKTKNFLITIPVKFICLYLFIFYIILLCVIYGKQEVNSIETNLLNIIDIPEMIIQKDR